jgi:glycosyltransferase involved in cell wall biosynthesis
MDKILVFFTSNFPYGVGETFIENEIDYLSSHFEKIVLVSNNTKDEQTRKTSKNIILIRQNFNLTAKEKSQALFSLFNPIVLKEFITSFKSATPILGKRLNYLLISFYKAQKINRFIKLLIKEHSLENTKLYLYSYWWLDEALGIALYKKENPKVIAITRAHGYDLYSFRQPNNYLPLKKFMIETLNKIYVISKNGKEYLLSNYNLPADNLSKIEIARLGTKILSNVRPEFINPPVFTIVSCSYIYPNKRVHLIAEALLLFTNTKINWIHIGDFTNWLDNEYKQKVLNLFEKINHTNLINIDFKGNLRNEELFDFYKAKAIDLFINASESEGIPVSIMEAMAFGIPAIATNVGGTNELVNEQNGYLLKADCTPQTIAETINTYIALNESEKTEKREAAYDTWNLNYNADKNYNKFVTELLNL